MESPFKPKGTFAQIVLHQQPKEESKAASDVNPQMFANQLIQKHQLNLTDLNSNYVSSFKQLLIDPSKVKISLVARKPTVASNTVKNSR